MNNKKIKWTILSVGIVICMALIFLISTQFKTQPVVDTKISPDSDISSDVAISSKTSEKDIIIKSEVSSELVSSETSEVDPKNKQQAIQTIQSDLQKPKEPTKPKIEDEKQLETPNKPPEYSPEQVNPNETEPDKPQGGEKQNGKIYVPGFGWIKDEGGGGEGTVAEDMYENGNKVGAMGE